jgi:hypothetical protein
MGSPCGLDSMVALVTWTPSQIWRSVHEVLVVLKQGLMWRIRKGEETDPWNDPWIPRDGMFRPLACLAQRLPSRVSAFVNARTIIWTKESFECSFYQCMSTRF